jgi:hypothetical protein
VDAPDSIDRARVVLLAAGLCLHRQNLPASIQSFHRLRMCLSPLALHVLL